MGLAVETGNITVFPYTDSGLSPHIATINHDNDKEDLVVFAIGHDFALNVGAANFSASYNFATMDDLGETQAGHQDDIPRLQAFFLKNAATGPNDLIVTLDVGANDYDAYMVVAISVAGVNQVGGVATDFSDSNAATMTAALTVQEAGSLILAVAAFQDGRNLLSTGAGFTPLAGGTLVSGPDDKSDFAAMLISGTAAAPGALDAPISATTPEDGAIFAIELRPAAVVVEGPPLSLSESFLVSEKPVAMIELDFDSGAFNFWTRPFTGAHGGKSYSPIAGLTDALTLRQSLDRPSLDAGAEIVGTSPELKNAALTEEFQLRPARILLGNIEEDGDIVSEVQLRGSMQDIPIVSDPEAGLSLSVVIGSVFADINVPRDLRLSAADQKDFDPNDSFFDFVDTVKINEPRFGA